MTRATSEATSPWLRASTAMRRFSSRTCALTLTGFIFVAFLGISRHYTNYYRIASTFATIDSAHNSPHCALSGYFQIPMAATSAWLRGLVQHVPSTRRRTGLSFSSLLPGSSLSLITPTLWGYNAIRLGAQRPLASTAAIQGGTQ